MCKEWLFKCIFVLLYGSSLGSTYQTANFNIQLPVTEYETDLLQPRNAINVTFTFTGPSAFYLLRFIPAAIWKQSSRVSFSDAQPSQQPHTASVPLTSIISQLSNQSVIKSLGLANVTYLLNRTKDGILPLPLWADRSVLIFSIRRLALRQLYLKTGACARVRICALPWDFAASFNPTNKSTVPMESLCDTVLKEIHLSCLDEPDEYAPLIMPLAHALAIEVDGLGSSPSKHNSSLSITASTGYSLPAGQFHCPEGLFACGNPSYTHRIANRSWAQRICLPLSLRCDGVINCPKGDSDEFNCSYPAPMEFDPHPADEGQQFEAYLRTIRPFRLVIQAGYPHDFLVHTAQLLWYYIVGMILFIIVLIAFLVVARATLCGNKSSGCSSQTDTEQQHSVNFATNQLTDLAYSTNEHNENSTLIPHYSSNDCAPLAQCEFSSVDIEETCVNHPPVICSLSASDRT